jgi:hypothetical protein
MNTNWKNGKFQRDKKPRNPIQDPKYLLGIFEP